MQKIMIVEDDEVIARAVQQSLVSWGMDAFCVQDFSCVLAEFAVKNPQLVLMDIHLPFFNGFHWCQEIRKVSKVPVIFLSSASDNMNIIMAVNMGGDDFIAKPFEFKCPDRQSPGDAPPHLRICRRNEFPRAPRCHARYGKWCAELPGKAD